MTAPVLAPPAPPCPVQVDCPAVLRAGYLAAYGVEVVVSCAAPLVRSTLGSWVCEHGRTHWITPAGGAR